MNLGHYAAFFKCLLIPLLMAISMSDAFSQQTITGSVVDSVSGDPLAGATILAVGTTTGTFADNEGKFTLQLPANASELRISYVGFTPKVISISGVSSLNVMMVSDSWLNEVVVIGYGTVKKEDATGSVQSVNVKDFNQGAINSPQELLAGKISGVQITQGNAPGEGGVIRIRGGSSLSAVNDPLIVIDGVPVSNDGISGSRNPLNIINPNDIQTFTVLKDASATAIYGSRASNGVIIITTKKGELGKKIRLGYDGNFSISQRANQIDVLNAEEYRALINEQFDDSHPARSLLGSENTDWQDQIYQTATGMDHNISASGALGVLPYRVSLGYTDRNGILKTDRFRRTTAGINLSPQFLDGTLQVNVNLKGMQSNNHFANRGAIGNAVRFDPTQPIYAENNGYGGYFTWLQTDGTPNTLAPSNPLALLEMRDDQSTTQRFVGNTQIDYRIPFLPDLRANLNLGYDYSKGEGSIAVPANAPFAFTDGGLDQIYSQEKKNELLEFYLNYVKEFKAFKLDLMGGYSWQHFFKEDYVKGTNADGSKTLTPENWNPKEYYLLSFFGRANLNLFDRILLTGTLRRDGTSRFSPDNRWGLFPAAAIAWKVLEGNTGKISNLKVRLGYGVTGQQDIGEDYYPYLARYTSSFVNARYQLGNDFITTLRPEEYDANIKWEETTTYNAAIDFGFLDDRVFGSFEIYRRETKDLLNFIPVPAGTNLSNAITTNVGDLENRGFEFTLNTVPIRKSGLTWEIGGNVTRNINKITRLTATDDPDYLGVFTGGIAGGVGNTIQIHSVGFPSSSFFVYEQVYDEAGVPVEGLYVDRNGDGQISPDDRYQLEQPAPDYFFGFTSNLTYKNFDFRFAGRANVGNYIYNNILSDQAFYNRLYNSTDILVNAHSATRSIDFAVPQYFSDHFIQDGSFLRVDHVTLGYNFSNMVKKMTNLRLSFVVQNPLLITQYEGLDPEVFSGIDGSIYPRSRTFVIGLSANL